MGKKHNFVTEDTRRPPAPQGQVFQDKRTKSQRDRSASKRQAIRRSFEGS